MWRLSYIFHVSKTLPNPHAKNAKYRDIFVELKVQNVLCVSLCSGHTDTINCIQYKNYSHTAPVMNNSLKKYVVNTVKYVYFANVKFSHFE